jgi:hypothetical protein
MSLARPKVLAAVVEREEGVRDRSARAQVDNDAWHGW